MNESTAPRVLVVDDERNLALGIAENLEAEGFEVAVAHDGPTALERAAAQPWDLILLDVMMPGMDGLAVCRTLRNRGDEVPILFLTARGSVEERVEGLDAGGDDYLPKPFALRELLARVSAIVRRGARPREVGRAEVVTFGDNRLDLSTYRGRSWDGTDQHLTHKEAMILACLAEREGEIVSREEILEKVWGYEVFPSTRTIDNFIVRLRKRFERDPEQPAHFHTERGVGYRFTRARGSGS
ncbi:MAG: response regulator transcription factor [Planctomycetota bacterium]|jgi:two-component system alkaline phosphatase synthesis response regulator PhoP|nr:response regulator transcription factor [Planctomycetota bacterium]MDP6762925.1 response regulator transcription factor [Planctomycetota bacterium]MDP6988613.1 response regulator transcription factor [Planctomycetota bacterium]